MFWTLVFIFLIGLWNLLDGLGSIFVYWQQKLIEHIPRVVRMILGIILMLLVIFNWS